MQNLLSAGVRRLWKDRVFWTLLVAIFAVSATLMFLCTRQAAIDRQAGFIKTLDNYYFVLAPAMGILCAVFTSLFIGTEYGEGTMRNKIIVGHTRTRVYLANYICCLLAGLCFLAAWLLAGLVGIPFVGLWAASAGCVITNVLVMVFLTATWTAIFTLLCMLSKNKAIMAVLSILLCIAMLVGASMIYNALLEPEFTNFAETTISGNTIAEYEVGGQVPNPYYLKGAIREVFEFLSDTLPGGQSMQAATIQIARPVLSLISSAVITVATLLVGLLAFRRKDLK